MNDMVTQKIPSNIVQK